MVRWMAALSLAIGAAMVPARPQDSSDWAPRYRVSPMWLALHWNTPGLVILHVGFDPKGASQTRSTYLDGHIPGAKSVDWDEIVQTRDGLPNELPPAEDLVAWVRSLGIFEGDRIILYDTGWGLEAARAYFTLDYLGLGERTAVLDGQWELWRSLSFPIERMPAEGVEPSNFVPKLRPEIRVDLQAVRDLSYVSSLRTDSVTLLDARAPEEFSGLKAGAGIARAGHIPGALNWCWRETYLDASGPLHRSDEDLRHRLEGTGARADLPLVVYCRTGVEACQVYLVAKSLGYPVRLYDGSYFEWSRALGTPVGGECAGQ